MANIRGTRTAQLTLPAGAYRDSTILWTADAPAGTSVTIDLSRDGGATWLACANGEDLPGLVVGEPLANIAALLRQTLETDDPAVTPTLDKLRIWVNTPVGAKTHVNLAAPLAAAPLPGAIWMLSGSDVAPQNFRIVAVTEPEKATYEITALRHEPGKYDLIEKGIKIVPAPISLLNQLPAAPANLKLSEASHVTGSATGLAISAGWDAVAGATGYQVEYAIDDGNVIPMPKTQHNTIDIPLTRAGTYTVWVAAVNAAGASPKTAAAVAFDGTSISMVLAPPSDVRATGGQDGIDLDWIDPTGVPFKEIVVYRSAHGANIFGQIGTSKSTHYRDPDTTGSQFDYYLTARPEFGLESPQSATVTAKAKTSEDGANVTEDHTANDVKTGGGRAVAEPGAQKFDGKSLDTLVPGINTDRTFIGKGWVDGQFRPIKMYRTETGVTIPASAIVMPGEVLDHIGGQNIPTINYDTQIREAATPTYRRVGIGYVDSNYRIQKVYDSGAGIVYDGPTLGDGIRRSRAGFDSSGYLVAGRHSLSLLKDRTADQIAESTLRKWAAESGANISHSATVIHAGTCSGDGSANCYDYRTLHEAHDQGLETNSTLEYDVWIDDGSVDNNYGIDISFSDGDHLRNHVPVFGLAPADSKWHSVSVPLASVYGKVCRYYASVWESDVPGFHHAQIRNVRLTHNDGSRMMTIYGNGTSVPGGVENNVGGTARYVQVGFCTAAAGVLTTPGSGIQLGDPRNLPTAAYLAIGGGPTSVNPIIGNSDGSFDLRAFTYRGGGPYADLGYNAVSAIGTGYGSGATKWWACADPTGAGGTRTWSPFSDAYSAASLDVIAGYGTTGSGSAPPYQPCVTPAMFIDAERRAADLWWGSPILCSDGRHHYVHPSWRDLWRALKDFCRGDWRAALKPTREEVPCVTVCGETGFALCCSIYTPFTLPDPANPAGAPQRGGINIDPRAAFGRPLFADCGDPDSAHWQTCSNVIDAGVQTVVHLHLGGHIFPAGKTADKRLYSHNMKT